MILDDKAACTICECYVENYRNHNRNNSTAHSGERKKRIEEHVEDKNQDQVIEEDLREKIEPLKKLQQLIKSQIEANFDFVNQKLEKYCKDFNEDAHENERLKEVRISVETFE